MYGRGFECDQQRGRKGCGWHSSFFGDWLTREATTDPSLSEPSFEGEVNSDDDLIREVKGYTEVGEMESDTQPQTTRGDLLQASHPARTRSSTGAGASTSGAGASTSGAGASTSGAGASTSGAQVLAGGSCYICRDWVSQITVKKLKLIACQYRLGEAILKPSPLIDCTSLFLAIWPSTRWL